jgi:GIY-YIG catalytic domain-containing protein
VALGDRNELQIASILEDSILVREMPEWTRLTLSWGELQTLPKRWQLALAQWRGIYFIIDADDGKGYVGAAYGSENILGRWPNYSKSGHGGNKLLKSRRPECLQFSILERVSPDMKAAEVQALEASWKDRLHTRDFGLNDN